MIEGAHSTMKNILASQPAAPGLIPREFLMLLRFNDGTAYNSGLGNVNRTHKILASGKLVLQKYDDW